MSLVVGDARIHRVTHRGSGEEQAQAQRTGQGRRQRGPPPGSALPGLESSFGHGECHSLRDHGVLGLVHATVVDVVTVERMRPTARRTTPKR